jgi:hypothetical protein
MEVHVWTVNDAPSMAHLMERGVDGIITDDPALAVQVRQELAELSAASRLLLQVRRFVLEGRLEEEAQDDRPLAPEEGTPVGATGSAGPVSAIPGGSPPPLGRYAIFHRLSRRASVVTPDRTIPCNSRESTT